LRRMCVVRRKQGETVIEFKGDPPFVEEGHARLALPIPGVFGLGFRVWGLGSKRDTLDSSCPFLVFSV
jgi:hypothetical protein